MNSEYCGGTELGTRITSGRFRKAVFLKVKLLYDVIRDVVPTILALIRETSRDTNVP